MNITKGKIPGAVKVVVYGPEGIGKSTFASRFPGAVFCDTEGSTNHMDVARFDPPQKWQDIIDTVDWCIKHPEEIGTFVLDTMDWAEKFGIRFVCQEELVKGVPRNWDNIEAPGYGKGYVYLKAAVQTLLDKLTQLRDKGVNIVITAHAQLKKFEQPDEMGAYDRWSLKLNEKNITPIVKEWADMVLFANFKTDVVKTEDKKFKARGGQKRVMYTQHSACWDAKNRFGLADELPFDFEQIRSIFPDHADVGELHMEPDPEPEPEKIVLPEKRVTITESASVPAPEKKSSKKKEETCPEPPEELTSDDPNKNKLLAALWMNMWLARITDPMIIRAVVAEKGYYESTVRICDYEYDFIEGCLIDAWEQVCKAAQSKAFDLPF